MKFKEKYQMLNFNRTNNWITILLVLIFILPINACKPTLFVSEEYERASSADIYESYSNHDKQIETLSVPRITIQITDGNESQSMRGSLRMKRDSIIMASFNAFGGVEAGRIKFTPDSVYFLNRIERVYFKGSYYDAKGFLPLPLGFDLLQGILIGNPFTAFEKTFSGLIKENSFFKFENEQIVLEYENESPVKHEFLNIADADLLRFQINNKLITETIFIGYEKGDRFYKINFNDHIDVDGVHLPGKTEILTSVGFNQVKLVLKISRANINTDVNFPFQIPDGYKSASSSEL